MYLCSLMEQNCYHVSKRTTALDFTPLAGTGQPAWGQQRRLLLSACRVGFRTARVNGTSVLIESGTKSLTFQ